MFGLFGKKCRQCGQPLNSFDGADERVDDLMRGSALGSATPIQGLCAKCRANVPSPALPISYARPFENTESAEPVISDQPDIEDESFAEPSANSDYYEPSTDYEPGEGYKSRVEVEQEEDEAEMRIIDGPSNLNWLLNTKLGRNVIGIGFVLVYFLIKSCASTPDKPEPRAYDTSGNLPQIVERQVLPPVPVADASGSPPKPANSPGSWVNANDYPSTALRDERDGTVRFSLKVGSDGRAEDCTILVSSGHSDLDAATCKAITRRARFQPATDPATGEAISGTYTNSVRWQIPN